LRSSHGLQPNQPKRLELENGQELAAANEMALPIETDVLYPNSWTKSSFNFPPGSSNAYLFFVRGLIFAKNWDITEASPIGPNRVSRTKKSSSICRFLPIHGLENFPVIG
jgi:hypothetical protein